MNKGPSKKVTITLPEEIKRELQEESKQNGFPLATYIKTIIMNREKGDNKHE